jgi:predicted secreted protein
MALAGHQTLVSAASTTSGAYFVLDGIKQFSVSDSRDLLDITDFKDAIVRARIVGLRDYQVTMSGEFESTDTGFQVLRGCYEQGVIASIAILHNTGTTAGYGYPIMLESMEISAGVDGTVEVSISGSASSGTTPFAIPAA